VRHPSTGPTISPISLPSFNLSLPPVDAGGLLESVGLLVCKGLVATCEGDTSTELVTEGDARGLVESVGVGVLVSKGIIALWEGDTSAELVLVTTVKLE